MRKTLGFFAVIPAILVWFFRGTIENWFFNYVLEIAKPNWSWAIEYGPPIFLCLLALYLLWPDIKSKIIQPKNLTTLHVGENDLLAQEKSRLYGCLKKFMVGVENTDEDKSLSKGKLQITSINPYVGSNGPWTLKENISLAPGAFDFIPLLEYGEGGKSTNSDSYATLQTTNEYQPLLDSTNTYEITLHFTSENRPFKTLKCKIWFENGKVHIKEKQ